MEKTKNKKEGVSSTERNYIVIEDPTSDKLLSKVKERNDVAGLRMQKLLDMPDLTKKIPRLNLLPRKLLICHYLWILI